MHYGCGAEAEENVEAHVRARTFFSWFFASHRVELYKFGCLYLHEASRNTCHDLRCLWPLFDALSRRPTHTSHVRVLRTLWTSNNLCINTCQTIWARVRRRRSRTSIPNFYKFQKRCRPFVSFLSRRSMVSALRISIHLCMRSHTCGYVAQ